jgi:hypothetical protein
VGGNGKKQGWHAAHAEGAAVDHGAFADCQSHVWRTELPFRMWKLTTSHCAVVHDVMIGTGFLDHLPGESSGVRRGKKRVLLVRGGPNCPHHVVKAADFCIHVVGSVACLQVLIVKAAVKNDMPFEIHVTGFRVIRRFVRPEIEVSVVNSFATMQLVNGPVFFLCDGTNVSLIRRRHRGRTRQLQLASN